MARPILSEYGPDTAKTQVPSMSKNGPVAKRDVMGYSPPQGPIGISRTPGPGLGGVNYGVCGTQGPKSNRSSESGSVGLHGMNRGMGSNRKG